MKRMLILLMILGLVAAWSHVSLAADGDPVLEPITIDQIESTDLSGSDGTLVTGTAGTSTYAAVWNADGDLVDGPGVPAVVALSNLASVAINESLISDTANTDDLGSDVLYWKKLFLASEIQFEGSTDDTHKTTISVTDPTGTRTITIPDSDQTVGTATSAAADAIDAITEIAAALKSGSDTTLITGTAGTNTYTAVWNNDGDLVDGYDPTTKADVAGDTYSGTHDFSGATLSLPSDAIDAIGEIKSTIRTGLDAKVVTGTAGSNGNLAVWNTDGDIVDGGSPSGTPGSFGTASAVQISSGVIDLSAGANYASVEGEGAAADDLTEIQGAAAGDVVVLQRKQGIAYTVTVKDGSYMQLQADFALDHDDDSIILICETLGANDIFKEIARANNG